MLPALTGPVSRAEVGEAMHALIRELYPLHRSLTGNGVRRTLEIIGRSLPLAVTEVPSGTAVFDWEIPREWNIRDAYIKNARGERVVDLRNHTLHVVGYSQPVHRSMSLAELRPHLHTLPEHPDWIPYRTSYYRADWGFCLSARQLESLSEGEYEVRVDSELTDGSLSYGECLLPGDSEAEVLFSSHLCHPSLANDNLSGLALAVQLGLWLAAQPRRRFTYRFLFAPGTLGAITWLAQHEAQLDRIRHGLVLTGVGAPGPLTYKQSRQGNAEIDQAAALALAESGEDGSVVGFSPYGYDERQYCSPGLNLPVGCLMRTPPGQYCEYHSSADNLDFVRPECLAGTLDYVQRLVTLLEGNGVYLNTQPKGEPRLGRWGLYRSGGPDLAVLWVLNLSDGQHSLLQIAQRSGESFAEIRRAADALIAAGLLVEVLP